MQFQNSDEFCAWLAERFDRVLLSFSMGKDSLAAYYQLRRFFDADRIIPVFAYLVPGLAFQERALALYEAEVFGRRIIRMPNPNLYNKLGGVLFQTPKNYEVLKRLRLLDVRMEWETIFEAVRLDLSLPPETPVAIGNRACDSPARRTALARFGPFTASKRKCYPVYDFNIERVLAILKDNKAFLPVDYEIWGRTFDGLDYRFIEPLKRNFPEDYARIKEYFPLIDLEIKRYEQSA